MESTDRSEMIARLGLFVENVTHALPAEFVLNEHDFHASFQHEGDTLHVVPHLVHPWFRGPAVLLVADSSNYIPRRLFGSIRVQMTDREGAQQAHVSNLDLGSVVIDDMLYGRAYGFEFWLDHDRLEQFLNDPDLNILW